MHTLRAAALGLALVLTPLAVPSAATARPISYPQLSTMIANMGYTPKQISTDPAKPKLEIQTKAGTFNVPMGIEITPSGRFVWVSVNLGVKTLSAEQTSNLLKRGANIQPSQFWITPTGHLYVGMAIDNREVTPAYLKFVIDKVGADVAGTADIWNV